MVKEFKRQFSPFTLFLLTMNAIVGSGWLFAPYYAAKIAGPGALLSWVIGGMAASLIALTYAELAAMLPVAGGTAHIPQLSHGPLASFILSWIAWLTTLMLTPIEVQAVIQYASLFIPTLMHEVNGAPMLSVMGYTTAALLMALLCIINIFSYRGLVRFNFILCIFKFSVIIITIFAIVNGRFISQNFAGFTDLLQDQQGWHAIFSAVATAGIVLAFNGFKSGVEMAGEAENLSIAMPIATIGSVLACLLIYLGLQVCFIGALDPQTLQHGWQALEFKGDIGPFVGLTIALGLFWLLKLLYVNAIISPLGAGLVYVTATSRILYAMSRIGYVPKFLSKLNKQKFPMWAIVANFCIGMFSFLPLPGWQAMVNFLISAIVISYAMGPIALLSLRQSLPHKVRPFKLPYARVISFLAFYACNLFSYWTGWETNSKLALMLLLGICVFALSCLYGNFKITLKEVKSGLWVIPYLSGLILISWLGTYGGINVIPFGFDFVVIAAFSVVILFLALHTSAPITMDEVEEFLLAEAHAFNH